MCPTSEVGFESRFTDARDHILSIALEGENSDGRRWQGRIPGGSGT